MQINPIDIAVLSSPIPLPRETGTIAPSSFGTGTQQNIQAITRGSGVTSPIGTGNTMTPMPYSPVGIPGQLEGGSTITGAALESGGANVGGLVDQGPKEDLETKLEFASLEDQKLDAQEKQQEEQAKEYMKAFEEGVSDKRTELIDEGIEKTKEAYDKLSDKNKERLDKIGLDSEKVGEGLEKVGKLITKYTGGDKTGMSGARTVKRQDRRADRKARRKAGLKGSEKRAVRKAQRKARRAAFDEFKSERDYQASLAAAQL